MIYFDARDSRPGSVSFAAGLAVVTQSLFEPEQRMLLTLAVCASLSGSLQGFSHCLCVCCFQMYLLCLCMQAWNPRAVTDGAWVKQKPSIHSLALSDLQNTKVQGAISHLFEGHTVNFVECINVDYKSNRKESYMDLQLDVKGCKNVYDSFVKYTEVEMLDGQNQYKAEGHGLQVS